MKTVTVLGSTGSVGTQTIELLLAEPKRFQVRALVAGRNAKLLAEQAIALHAEIAVVADPGVFDILRDALAGTGIQVAAGYDAVIAAAALQADLRRARIEPFAWVINQSLLHSGTCDPLLQSREAAEHRYLTEVVEKHAHRTAWLPWQPEEPIGPDALARLAASGEKAAV